MLAADLLRRVHETGASLSTVGDDLKVTPAGRLPPELRADLVTHKAEVLAYLASPQCWDVERARRILNNTIEDVAGAYEPETFDADSFHAFDRALAVAFDAKNLVEVRKACSAYRTTVGTRSENHAG